MPFIEVRGTIWESTMRAAIRDGNEITFKTNVPIPKTVEPGSALIRIKAAAINPIDYKLSSTIFGSGVGLDFAGVIESIEGYPSGFLVGDEVYGKLSGSLADFGIAKIKDIALKPRNIGFPEAAAIPLTYLTALQGLRNFGRLRKGARVLIVGASGGCGIAALQLSKCMGASWIVAICSGKNAEIVKFHGADEVIDYQRQSLVGYFRHEKTGEIDDSLLFDVIFDAASSSGAGEYYKSESIQLLAKEIPNKKGHGQYVATSCGYFADGFLWISSLLCVNKLYTTFPKNVFAEERNEHLILYDNNSDDLKYLSNLVEVGWKDEKGNRKKLSPVLDSLLSFNSDNVAQGFTILKSRRAVGKVVFDMSEEK